MVGLTAVVLDANGVLGAVGLCDIGCLHVIEGSNVVVSKRQE